MAEDQHLYNCNYFLPQESKNLQLKSHTLFMMIGTPVLQKIHFLSLPECSTQSTGLSLKPKEQECLSL
uniref:Uncharacterized protein n=1 Tax=Salix viminalis TaxID=40686 RepID=A0A6N2KR64_SALVM